MTAKTGEKCPVSGVWKVDGFPTTTAPIAKGNTMPPYCGKAVTWGQRIFLVGKLSFKRIA